MSPRMLNFIIAISMVGMLFIVVKEKYYPSAQPIQATAQPDQTNQTQIDAASATQADPEIPCKNAYFSFNPKSTWKYKLSTNETFTSTIATASATSVTINSKLASAKEPLTSTLTCKESGIYGLPFIPITSKSIPQTLVDSILLIPSTKELTKSQTWTSTIDLGIQIPFIATNGITIKSTVEKVTDVSATIGSTLDLGSIPANLSPIGNGKILEYTLVKGVGISDLKVMVGQDGKASSGFNITLSRFGVSKQ